MKRQAFYFFVLLFLQTISSSGQVNAIHHLDEVVLSDVYLKKNSQGQKVRELKDSIIEKHPASLTSILRFNSPLYFKENGPGMVASVSYRGTSASQTAVLWNGININSQLTGQTDFNTLISSNYDNVTLRSGGGSVLYGSGAIGGSVHLNNKFRFSEGFQNKLQLKYGSFNTFFGSYTGKYSSEAAALQINAAHYISDNDFKYIGTDRKNLNGDFQNSSINMAAAYILNDRNTIKIFSNYFSGERGFSGTLFAPSKAKYEDRNSRNLLQWTAFSGEFTSNLKLAYLDETYRYYENRERKQHSHGRVKSGIFKYDLKYELQPSMKLTALVDLNYSSGNGTNIGEAERKAGSLGLMFSHDLEKLGYTVSLKKEITDQYESPLLFSMGAEYAADRFYDVRFNLSRNYRVPTFNDLFWYAGGNKDLQPEESLQAEVGQILHFREVVIDATAFFIRINDMLRWIPGSDGLWQPENTSSVQNYGIELSTNWKKNFENKELEVSAIYAWTRARNLDLDRTLIYVPEHKVTAAIAYKFKGFSSYYEQLYNGSVFTSSDNSYSMGSYHLSNLGVEYDVLGTKKVSIGMEVQNVWNKSYQIMPSRPMPGRSINATLTVIL